MSLLQGHDVAQACDDLRQRVVAQFHDFPFASDDEFQRGLAGILAREPMTHMPNVERSKLVLKAQVFYFNRVTGHDISLEDVQARYTADLDRFHALSGNEYDQTSSGVECGEMHTLTLAELKCLIEQGKMDKIPNNKTIPDTLNDGVPSESIAQQRKKPWEAAS